MRRFFILHIIGFLISSFAFCQQETKKRFDSRSKEFNDWHITIFGGANWLQNSDLVSWGYGGFNPGYDFELSVAREINHTFALMVTGQLGKTHQFAKAPHFGEWHRFEGKTEYFGLNFMGDLNLSNILRRSDNHTEFKWALHAYAGAGIIKYKALRRTLEEPVSPWETTWDVKLNDRSVYSRVGLGIRYKMNRRLDWELRTMYVMTGDEEFDGSGQPFPGYFTLADLEEGRDDNMVTLSLGLHYKFGKHKESLQWTSPSTKVITETPQIPPPCADEDNDGVCDLYDQCPGTPAGYPVDGAGCPLDTDRDGVPDKIDECPTIPGPPTNNGCPRPIIEVSMGDISTNINELIEGIEFDYNTATIRPESFKKLDAVFYVLDAHPTYKFYVEGHTDAAGSAAYNKDLSERRAAAVVRYLVNKGVPVGQLIPVGKGKSELKWPECDPTTNCPAWKNFENRRVIFKPYGEAPANVDFKK